MWRLGRGRRNDPLVVLFFLSEPSGGLGGSWKAIDTYRFATITHNFVQYTKYLCIKRASSVNQNV